MNNTSLIIALFILVIASRTLSAQTAQAGRQRLSFNEGWLFRLDDPPGAKDELDYQKLKSSLLITGRRNIDPASTAPPVENIGRGVSYTSKVFDDSGWRK